MNTLNVVESIFFDALEKETPEARAAYLDDACRGDDNLRRCVERLLSAHPNADRIVPSQAPGLPKNVEQAPTDEGPGTNIGPYKLLEKIGEGGFGVVYMAEQTQPVRRKVALKVLKPGMDTRQVVARFEAERQALAIMDHPHIAKVHDGGATPSGRPYFVMELVKGVPITDFCDENNLTPRQRLELFLPVCQAVQHAHHKGIIHRDLKPSNILVTVHDTTPVVKVIDFGVAKALGQELTDRTLFTGFAQMIGTPLYMSPEQAGQSGLDIDTRSDIYSLGVLLYELLTGTTPFDKERFMQAAHDEIRRIIREEEPPKPSTRLSELSSPLAPREENGRAKPPASSLAFVAAQRQTEPAKLTKLVRGELDWIVMKCLEKDRNRRYETVNGFAADVQRYLLDEPVQACPPSVGYRLRKFARKYRTPLRFAGAFALLLLAGVLTCIWQAVRATLAERQSKTNEQAARTQEGLANENAERAERQRQEAISNLYGSLVGEARALRLARVNGYRAKAWQKLKDALKLDTPRRNVEELRQEAVACIGDFTGLEPITLSGFKAQISAVAAFPQGTGLAIGLNDGTVLIKSLPTGTDLATLREHRAGVTALTFARDGNKLVSADGGGMVKVWEPDSTGGWTCSRTITAGGNVRSLALAPDGAQLAICCPGTATIGLWNLADGARVADFNAGEGDLLWSMALSADGGVLAAYYYRKNAPTEHVGRGILVWDVAARQLQARREWPLRLTRHGPVHGMAFSADGKRLACASGGIILLDTADYQDRTVVQLDIVWALSFSPDNRTLALNSQSNVVRLWDVVVNREAAVLDHHAGSVAFSANGQVLLSSSADVVKVWSPAATAEKRSLLGHGGGQVPCVAFSPDGKLLASSGGHDGTVVLWDTATGRRIRSFPAAVFYTQSVAFSPDGRILATGERAGRLEFWDVATGEKLLAMQHALGGDAVAFSPNGGYVAACGNQGVTLWRIKGELPVAAHSKPVLELTEVYQARLSSSELPAVYFSPDSKRLVCALDDGTLHVCDVENRRPCLSPPARIRGSLLNGGFFPDSEHLLVLGATPEVWDVATGEKTASFGPGEFVPSQTVLSGDGRRLAVRRRAWALDVWDVATRKRLLSLPEERMHIWSHALSADGELLAVGQSDGGLSIWNLAQVQAQLEEIGMGWKQEPGAGPVVPKEAEPPAARRHENAKLHMKHGQLLTGRNRSQEAELSYRQAVGILEQLARDSPGTAEYRRSLSEANASLRATVGAALFEMGDFDGAAAALDVAERNEAASPNAERKKLLAAVYRNLAFVRAQKGQWEQAASESAKAVNLGADPADLTTSGWQLAWLRMYSEDVAEHRGNCLRLLERYEKTTSPWLALLAARICVLRADRAIEPSRAIQLAKRGTELEPDNAHFWDTLGLTYYRAGDWKAAVAALDKAAPFRAQSGSVDEWPFVLAMAHWQLGDKEQAGKWYDHGTLWLEENKQRLDDQRFGKEIHSFRDEAAAVLGIKDLTAPKEKPAKE